MKEKDIMFFYLHFVLHSQLVGKVMADQLNNLFESFVFFLDNALTQPLLPSTDSR